MKIVFISKRPRGKTFFEKLLYFILYRLVGVDASCPKHTLFLQMTPLLIYYTGLYKNKMVKYASVHDRVKLDWSPISPVFKIVKRLIF
jgi:hypothetical protein